MFLKCPFFSYSVLCNIVFTFFCLLFSLIHNVLTVQEFNEMSSIKSSACRTSVSWIPAHPSFERMNWFSTDLLHVDWSDKWIQTFSTELEYFRQYSCNCLLPSVSFSSTLSMTSFSWTSLGSFTIVLFLIGSERYSLIRYVVRRLYRKYRKNRREIHLKSRIANTFDTFEVLWNEKNVRSNMMKMMI